ncbi:MAG: carboxypeptidase regulatory-like domain-containing protein [Bryobacterales bacterium]|nr:carboxypeptidase regulatory-like domain-containing protein [Bryobacterales bacterium]
MKLHYCFLMIAIPLASFGQPAPQQEVKKGAIEGVVLVETTREPVRRVQVMAYPRRTSAGPGATMGQPQSFTATTDAEGKFTIADLEPGDYFLNIQKQGFSIARRSTFASSMQIKVGQGETVKGLRYALLPQAVIAGKVLDDEGEPAGRPGPGPGTAEYARPEELAALRSRRPDQRSGRVQAGQPRAR